MQQLAIAICDLDCNYGRSLTEYWMQKREFSRVAFLEGNEGLTQRLQKEGADIWLISPDYLTRLQEEQRGGSGGGRPEPDGWDRLPAQVMCLAEETVTKDMMPYPCIYKYQSADEILRRIYQNLEGQPLISERYHYRRGCAVGLCTPWYNGSSLLAGLALSAMLSRKGRVLYVNARKYHGLDEMWDGEEIRNLSDIIIALRESESNVGAALKGVIFDIGDVSCIAPVKAPRQLEGMEVEDLVRLLSAIWKELQYEYVVLEVDPELAEINLLLEQCDHLYGFLPPAPGAKRAGELLQEMFDPLRLKLYLIPDALHITGAEMSGILAGAVSEQITEWIADCMKEEEL